MRKMISGIATVALLASMLVPVGRAAEAWESRDGDGLVRIGVISDIHVTTEESNERMKEALAAFKTVDPTMDGLILNGDIAYQCPPNGVAVSTTVSDEMYDYIFNAINAEYPGLADKYIWPMGNHEYPQLSRDEALTEQARQYHMAHTNTVTSVNGVNMPVKVSYMGDYTVIAASAEDYFGVLSTDVEDWIMDEIEKAAKIGGSDKPIFLCMHHPIQNTVVGSSDVTCSDDFREFLKGYPNVINISSHIHAPSQNPKTIWQDGFTAIGTPYLGINGYVVVEGEASPNRSQEPYEAMMIEIDSSNVVRVYKMDIGSGSYIGEPWVIDVPAMSSGDTSAYHYTSARFAKSNIPVFPDGAEVAVEFNAENTADITFPQAVCAAQDEWVQDGFVEYYKITLYNKDIGATVGSTNIPSGYHNSDSPGNGMPESVTAGINNLVIGTTYTVNVTPVSPFGVEGEALGSEPFTIARVGIPTDGSSMELIPVTDQASSSGTTGLGDKSVGFHMGNTIDFNVYATESGWYDVGVSATNWSTTDVAYSVIINGMTSNQIIIKQTVDGITNSPDDYFVAEDFWNTPGFSTYGLGAEYGSESKVPIPQKDHVWLVKGENTVRLTVINGSTALHKLYLRKVQEEYADPNAEYLCQTTGAVIAYTGYGTTAREKYNDGSGFEVMRQWKPALVSYEVMVPTAGRYDLKIIGGVGEGGAATVDVFVNSNQTPQLEKVTLEKTGEYSIYGEHECGSIYLNEGINLLTFTKDNFPFFFGCYTLRLTQAEEIEQTEFTIPAMFGTAFSMGLPADGWTYMNFPGGSWVEFTLNVSEEGWYDFTRIGSTSGEPGRYIVYTNDEQMFETENLTYGAWVMGTDKLGRVYLNKGKNKLKVRNEDVQAFLDSITLSKASDQGADGISAKMFINDAEKADITSGTITAVLSPNGSVPVGEELDCFLAIYNENESLAAVGLTKTTLENADDDISVTIPSFEAKEGEKYTAKAFVWDKNMSGKSIILDAE